MPLFGAGVQTAMQFLTCGSLYRFGLISVEIPSKHSLHVLNLLVALLAADGYHQPAQLLRHYIRSALGQQRSCFISNKHSTALSKIFGAITLPKGRIDASLKP